MMKKVLFLCLGMMSLSFGMPQTVSARERIVASKRHITRTIEVSSFDHIKLNGSSDIIFTPTTDRQKLSLTLPENLVDVVRVYVKDRTLILEMKPGVSVQMDNECRVELRVSAPMVESVVQNGSGDFSITSHAVSQKPFNLTMNGVGDFDSKDIKAASLTALVNGAGDIDLGKITADRVQATVNGVGDVTVNAIQSKETNVMVNGGGDLTAKDIHAESVTATIKGSGDVELDGSSEEAHYILVGSGDIEAAGLMAKKVTAKVVGSGDINCYASESIVMNQKRNRNAIICAGNPKHVVRNGK